jgi:hypothetical protein
MAKKKAAPVNTEVVTREEVVPIPPEAEPGRAPEECVGCGQLIGDTDVVCKHCNRRQFTTRQFWTWPMRFDMYVWLRQKFGGIDGWNAASNKEQEAARLELVEILGKNRGYNLTEGAIDVQISWATRKPASVDKRQTPTFIHNRSAAHAAGFIGNQQLEITLQCDWE